MKKCFLITLYVIFIIILMVVVAFIANPLLRTEAGIRRQLLRNIPIGTSMEDVIRIADENANWIINVKDEHIGIVLHPTLFFPMRNMPRDRGFPVVGERSVRVHLGTYHIIIRVDVSAYFAFDEESKLIEIFVRKQYDLI